MHSFFVFVAGHCRRWLPHKVRLDFITAGVISDPEAASSLATALQNHKSAGCSILPLSVSSSPSLPLSLSGAICITPGLLDGFVKNTCSTEKYDVFFLLRE